MATKELSQLNADSSNGMLLADITVLKNAVAKGAGKSIYVSDGVGRFNFCIVTKYVAR